MSAPVRSGASSEPYITLVTGNISTEHNINIKHILHNFTNNVQVLFRCYSCISVSIITFLRYMTIWRCSVPSNAD